MAHVTMPDGREFDIPDADTALEAYYLGEGATVDKQAETAAAFPRVYVEGELVDLSATDEPDVEAEQVPEVEQAQTDEAAWSHDYDASNDAAGPDGE